MTITVYQYVFADGTRTRVHTTIVNEAGAVLDRNIANYEAFPLKQIAEEHAQYMLRVLKRSLAPDRVIYECNIRGRFEYSATEGGFKGELVWHPRFGKAEKKVRLQWADPAPEEPEDDEEESEE
ncbi:MAG: hypothetical protein E7E23_02235 [Paenibacillus sp.]|uniref:hypothetical protein n=1 Tax=Paenibacillus sp. TaxID=58172 RepID=UPI002902C08F|nr:hypothetical protein [Paenibacillus sp.]MDU2239369.1 hypothetical protein [Paenibacillus sp.]